MRVLYGFGQRLQPPLWLPLSGILAPDRLVRVACLYIEKNGRAFWDGHLPDDGTIGAAHRF